MIYSARRWVTIYLMFCDALIFICSKSEYFILVFHLMENFENALFISSKILISNWWVNHLTSDFRNFITRMQA
jgi:hypothetical protein